MPKLDDLYLIVLSEPSPALREAVHEMVEQHSPEWWHQIPDVWIVQGGSSTQWRDRIGPLKTAASAKDVTVLVLALPDSERWWASSGPDNTSTTAWLKEYYTARK